MTDTPPALPHPAEDYEKQADSATKAAEATAHEGHNGHGSDERQGYAAIAQVHATLAVAAETRALSLRIEDALITMLDREPAELRTLDPIEQMLLRGPEQPRPIDKTAVALIGLVVFAVLCVAAAGTVIGLGFGLWSAPFFFGSAFAVAVVAAQSGKRQ